MTEFITAIKKPAKWPGCVSFGRDVSTEILYHVSPIYKPYYAKTLRVSLPNAIASCAVKSSTISSLFKLLCLAAAIGAVLNFVLGMTATPLSSGLA